MSAAIHSADQRATGLLGEPQGALNLRVRGSSLDGRVIRVHSKRCAVGSASQCGIRIDAERVRPVHCVIFRGAHGAVVRRWSPDTLINGQAFEDAWLRPGDRLAMGPVEFEVLNDEQAECALGDGRLAEARWADERRQLFEQLTTLEHQLRELQQERDDAPAVSAQVEDLLRQLRNQDLESEQAAEQWQRERLRLDQHARELRAALDESEEQRERQSASAGELEQLRGRFALQQEKLAEVREANSALHEEVDERRGECLAAQLQADQLQYQLIELQQQAAAAADLADQARQFAEQLDVQQRFWRERSERLERECGQLRDESEQQRDSWRRELDIAHPALDEAESFRKQQEEFASQRESQQTDWTNEREQLRNQAAALEQDVAELRGERDDERSRADELTAVNDDLTNRTEELSRQLTTLETEYAQFQETADQQRGADAETEAERAELRRRAEDAEAARDEIAAELDERAEELSQREQSWNELQERFEAEQSRWQEETRQFQQRVDESTNAGAQADEELSRREEQFVAERESWIAARDEWTDRLREQEERLAIQVAESEEQRTQLQGDVNQLNELLSEAPAEGSADSPDGDDVEQLRAEFDVQRSQWSEDKAWFERELENRAAQIQEQQSLLGGFREQLESNNQEREQLELDLVRARQDDVSDDTPVDAPRDNDSRDDAQLNPQAAAAMSFLDDLRKSPAAEDDASGSASAFDETSDHFTPHAGGETSFVLEEDDDSPSAAGDEDDPATGGAEFNAMETYGFLDDSAPLTGGSGDAQVTDSNDSVDAADAPSDGDDHAPHTDDEGAAGTDEDIFARLGEVGLLKADGDEHSVTEPREDSNEPFASRDAGFETEAYGDEAFRDDPYAQQDRDEHDHSAYDNTAYDNTDHSAANHNADYADSDYASQDFRDHDAISPSTAGGEFEADRAQTPWSQDASDSSFDQSHAETPDDGLAEGFGFSENEETGEPCGTVDGGSSFSAASIIDSLEAEEELAELDEGEPRVTSWRGQPEPPADDEPADAAGEGDESIESYMNRLLQRVRGDDEDPVIGAQVAVHEDEVEPSGSTLQTQEGGLQELAPPSAPEPVMMKPEEYRPRSQAPELDANLSAMRALANDSAREAITSHEIRSWDDSAKAKLLKAGLALVVGGVTVSIGGIFDPLAMVGGVAALSIAGVWVFQSRKFSSRSRSIADDDAPNGPAEGQSIECTVESTQSRLTDHLGRAGDAIDADFSSMREELREAATSEPDVSEMSVDAELDAFERDLLESNRSAT